MASDTLEVWGADGKALNPASEPGAGDREPAPVSAVVVRLKAGACSTVAQVPNVQFIGIYGTIVGGLAGRVIHAGAQLLG